MNTFGLVTFLMYGGFDEFKSDGSEADCARRGGDSGHRSACLGVRAKTQEYDGRPAAKVWARMSWLSGKWRSSVPR